MKRAAFYMDVGVISTQLIIIAAAIAGCFVTRTDKCDGSKSAELMTYIVAQSFALYASEK